jgi:hypothetical protein
MDMLRSLVGQSPTGDPFPVDRPSLELDRDRSMMRSEHEIALILQEHNGVIGIADLTGAFDNRLQRRTNVSRRGGDYP